MKDTHLGQGILYCPSIAIKGHPPTKLKTIKGTPRKGWPDIATKNKTWSVLQNTKNTEIRRMQEYGNRIFFLL